MLKRLFPEGRFSPPATETAIVEAERQLGVTLPSQLRELYLICDGFREDKSNAKYLFSLADEDYIGSLVSITKHMWTEWNEPDLRAFLFFGSSSGMIAGELTFANQIRSLLFTITWKIITRLLAPTLSRSFAKTTRGMTNSHDADEQSGEPKPPIRPIVTSISNPAASVTANVLAINETLDRPRTNLYRRGFDASDHCELVKDSAELAQLVRMDDATVEGSY